MDDGHIADGREILEQVHPDLVGGAVDHAGVPGTPSGMSGGNIREWPLV